MMVGVVRGADGAVLGQQAIDPTAPGGLTQQLQNIAAKVATAHGVPPTVPSGPRGPQLPFPGVQPVQVFLRFALRLPDGSAKWIMKAINIPPTTGIPPGIYVLQGQGQAQSVPAPGNGFGRR